MHNIYCACLFFAILTVSVIFSFGSLSKHELFKPKWTWFNWVQCTYWVSQKSLHIFFLHLFRKYAKNLESSSTFHKHLHLRINFITIMFYYTLYTGVLWHVLYQGHYIPLLTLPTVYHKYDTVHKYDPYSVRLVDSLIISVSLVQRKGKKLLPPGFFPAQILSQSPAPDVACLHENCMFCLDYLWK